jgi:hypothetical protein
MPLTWETPNPGLGPTLGYDAEGVWIARVRKVRNAWHGWYDPAGLERPPRALSGPADDEAGYLVGTWASAGEALAAVDRYHDRHVTRLPGRRGEGRPGRQ